MQIVVNEQLKDAIEWTCKYADEYKVDIDIHIDADGEVSVSVTPGYYEEDEWAVPFKEITSAPSIEIIRCKECKHRPIKKDAEEADYGFNISAPNGDERCPCLVEDGWYSWMPNDNFYCGFGERKESE